MAFTSGGTKRRICYYYDGKDVDFFAEKCIDYQMGMSRVI